MSTARISGELRVGIVGFGGAGMANFRRFHEIGQCRVTSVYDPIEAGLERAGKFADNLLLTQDFDKLLNSEIDAVCVCTPDGTPR